MVLKSILPHRRPRITKANLPAFFGNLHYRLVQRLAHPRADGKPDESPRSTLPVFVPQPVDQMAFVARQIAPIVISRPRFRRRRVSLFGPRQRCHHRRHIPVPKLIRPNTTFISALPPTSADSPSLPRRLATLPAWPARA